MVLVAGGAYAACMRASRNRWFWMDVAGLCLSLALLTWALWSSLEAGVKGSAFAVLPAMIFTIRLARRARGPDAPAEPDPKLK